SATRATQPGPERSWATDSADQAGSTEAAINVAIRTAPSGPTSWIAAAAMAVMAEAARHAPGGRRRAGAGRVAPAAWSAGRPGRGEEWGDRVGGLGRLDRVGHHCRDQYGAFRSDLVDGGRGHGGHGRSRPPCAGRTASGGRR